jgi:hypothetical protein
MTAAFAAHTARHIGGMSSVLEVVPTGCRQGGLQFAEPFLVGLGELPDMVGGHAKITERVTEWLATVDCIEELLAQLDG